MQITQKQFEASHLLDQEGFIALLCEELDQDVAWVRNAWPPPVVRDMVQYSYDRATIANGLTRDVDIKIYVTLFFDISCAFDQHPAIAKILHNSLIPPDEKWKIIGDESGFHEVWAEVEKHSSEALLFPEAKGRIEDAYPVTYHLSGFQKLYAKIRKEKYYYLENGETLNIE